MKHSALNKYEVRFRNVEIRGEVRSWRVRLKDWGAATLIKHLKDKGLVLDCFSTARFTDSVAAEEWDEAELHGRIVLGGTRQIGSFVVRELSADEIVDDAQAAPDHTVSVVCVAGGYPTEIPGEAPDEVPF